MENSQLLSKTGYKMFQKERISAILKILEQNEFVTVKYLTKTLNYSNATINRDLNVMEKEKLIKRSYGGVELIKNNGIALPFRYEKMKASKIKIAKKAAEFIENGDTVFIDSTTTTEYIGQYLIDKKDITVITNNMALAIFLSNYSIDTICLGGKVAEKPYMLLGDETLVNARRYHAKKMFFSTGGVSLNGCIDCHGIFNPLHEIMMENSDEIFFLASSEKIIPPNTKIRYFDNINYVITDFEFSEKVRNKYKNTSFITV